MRTAFIRSLMQLAEHDQRITLVVGDLGFGVVEQFAEKFPKQFLNPGVAEQNMTGIAAGLALSGRIVFTYSIANFPTLRCLEQIRNDICYHNANVKIVSVGGGFSYGALGMTHHATEDIAILRSLPRMTVIAPGDTLEAELATKVVAGLSGPCYLRLGRAGEARVHTKGDITFEVGKAITLRQGRDISLISTGAMLQTVVKVAGRLEEEGVNARVISMHTVKPLDEGVIVHVARETGIVVTIEEHSVIGGLGSAVAEVLAESGLSIRFKRIGLKSEFTTHVGDQEYLREINGLSEEGIYLSLKKILSDNEHYPREQFTNMKSSDI